MIIFLVPCQHGENESLIIRTAASILEILFSSFIPAKAGVNHQQYVMLIIQSSAVV